jgi:glucokinase
VPSLPVVAAVDVGGTRTKCALVAADLAPVVTLTAPTPRGLHRDGALVRHVSRVVEQLLEGVPAGEAVELRAVGAAVPGLVDEPRGVAVRSVNLGWSDVAVVEPLSRHLGLPVVLGHDVRAGLVAEMRLGAARGAQHALFVPVGTGIAGAFVLDGRVVVAGGRAGELGHVVVEPDGSPCSCGSRGCLETVASAPAIERAYAERTSPGGTATTLGGDGIADLVAAGDPTARAVWHRAVDALGGVVATAVIITGVELVVVGGGLSCCGEVLLRPLRASIGRGLGPGRAVAVRAAGLGDRAGCLGAACLAWDAL